MRILLDGLDRNGDAYWYVAGVFLSPSYIYMLEIVLGDGCSYMRLDGYFHHIRWFYFIKFSCRCPFLFIYFLLLGWVIA